MKEKSWIEKLRDQASNVLGHPNVRMASGIGERVLDITHQLANNPSRLAIASALATGANVIADALDISYVSAFMHYAKKNNLQSRAGNLHRLLLSTNLDADENHKVRVVCKDFNECLCRISLADNCEVYYAMRDPNSEHYSVNDRLGDSYWVNEGFDSSVLASYFWTQFPNGINLSYGGKSGEETQIAIEGLPQARPYIELEHSIGEMRDYLLAAREAGISRSFLVFGRPGTGKTTFIENLANHFNRRVVKVESTFIDNVSTSELSSLIEILHPEILLFDDFDRIDVEKQEGKILFMVETLKRKFADLAIFATVNDREKLGKAITREGRFDEYLEFDLIGADGQLSIVEYYCAHYKLVPPKQAELPGLGETMLTPVQLEEMVKRKRLSPSAAWVDLYVALATKAAEEEEVEE